MTHKGVVLELSLSEPGVMAGMAEHGLVVMFYQFLAASTALPEVRFQ